MVRLADAPAPIDPNTGRAVRRPTVSRVLDVDLQTRGQRRCGPAGAEAIAINGQRLTATSTIRAAGSAILVDFRPVTSPYEVSAIGPDDLEDGSTESPPAAARIARPGRASTASASPPGGEDDLTLPAAPSPTLRYAHPVSRPSEPRCHPSGGDR